MMGSPFEELPGKAERPGVCERVTVALIFKNGEEDRFREYRGALSAHIWQCSTSDGYTGVIIAGTHWASLFLSAPPPMLFSV